jgi:two-component system heavy metal sensor histidine kinase CusS
VRISRSIVARLTIWYACSAFALILISTIALYGALVANLDREDEEFTADIVNIVRAFLRDRPQDVNGLKQTVEWEWARREYAQIYVRVIDARGHPVVETPQMSHVLDARVFPAPVAVTAQPGRGVEILAAGSKSFRAVSALARVGSDRSATRVIQVALDQAHEESLLSEYRKRLWLVLSIALVACTAVGYAIARRGVQPIAEITETARRIHSSTLDSRIHTAGLPAELFSLGETFNTMLAGLEDSFGRLSRFSADIAHELRTPVNNRRGEAEVALRQPRTPEEYRYALESLLEEGVRLSRMIDSLLFVARAESPETQISRERLNVARELNVIKEFYEAPAAEAGVDLIVDADEDLWAGLDRTLLQRAISNLVANALDHTPQGGRATLTARRDDGELRVDVADTGCGIPPEHLPRVFDRFYRVDASRSARSGRLGLGLALVKSIVDLHDGSVEIASEPGQGTTVTLRIPRTEMTAP